MSEQNWPRGVVFQDIDGWDQDECEPGIHTVAAAIQVWSVFQNREQVTVREAADAFNLDDAQVRQAVEAHYWMYLDGPDDDPTRQTIQHDGE